MTKGYNLPDDVSASCPDAPWNKTEEAHTCELFEANERSEICAWQLYNGRCGRIGYDIYLTKCKED